MEQISTTEKQLGLFLLLDVIFIEIREMENLNRGLLNVMYSLCGQPKYSLCNSKEKGAVGG